ncbi:MAG: uracil-DNA glycosylase [Phycisphaerales bacterium]|nr:uracil-DNA glycosylase [Phycisphaerales bacterium]
MPNVKKVIHQWLETDSAFGIEEVPLPRPAPQPSRPVPRPSESVASSVPAHPIPRPAPPAPTFALSSAPQSKIENQKSKIENPPIPTGNIAALPPLTKRQKADLLEALRQQTCDASAPFINNISTKVVFGEGNPDASLMFIGEGPGIEEDRTGRPFVGRSGQLLDKMIAAMGLKRDPTGIADGVYIANVVKLRCADPDPTTGRLKDRPPTPEEAARGLPVLHQQIAIIRPKVIVTLGAPAIKHLTGTTQGVMSIRGTWFSFRGIPVMPTYHPSFLLRAYTEENRRKVWNDLQLAMKKLHE